MDEQRYLIIGRIFAGTIRGCKKLSPAYKGCQCGRVRGSVGEVAHRAHAIRNLLADPV